MKGKNQLKVGSVLTYIQMALSIIIGLLYTPMMIRLLGQSEYGLYNTVSSTISMLSILNLGFSSGYIRHFAKYKMQHDEYSIRKLNGVFLIIFSIIGCIALFCGVFLITNLQYIFGNGLTATEYSIAKILMILLTVSLTISFPMTVFTSIINANERFVFLKLLGMGKTVLSPVLTIPLLLMGYGAIGVVSVSVVVGFLVDILYVYYVLVILKNKFIFHDFEYGIFKSIFRYTAFIAIIVISDQINWNIDKFILGRYCGTVVVAIYSIGATLQTYYQMFSTAVSGVFAPRIHKIQNNYEISVKQKNAMLTELFIKVGRIQFIILALVLTGFVFFGKEFIALWAGEGYEESYGVALLLMVPVTILLIQNLGNEIQRAKNKHQIGSIIYAAMAVVNLMLTLILCPKYGALGAAFGTAISLVLSTGIIMNIIYYYVLDVDVKEFWMSILKLSRGIIIPVIMGIGMKRMFDFHSAYMFIGGIGCYVVVYVISMWFVGMNSYEKKLLLSIVHRRKS